ncbi:hypothetical protein [Streptomyces sp. NPDC057702]|uniref:hypothetical protein n=1 Tax=unclassified Streptomyces TaxID=2593676 RepID=UPI00368231DE
MRSSDQQEPTGADQPRRPERPEQVEPKEPDETQVTPDLPPTVEVPEADTDSAGRPPPAEDAPVGKRPHDEPEVPEHPG